MPALPRMDGHAGIAAANRHHARDPHARSSYFRPHDDFAGSLRTPVMNVHR